MGVSRLQRPALGIAALLLLCIVGVSYHEWAEYHTINAAAQSTREIVEGVDRVRSGVLDAEASERGFLLTGDPAYLEPYRRALVRVPMELDQLKKLMVWRPGGFAQATTLGNLVDRKFADMSGNIEDRRKQGKTPSVERMLGDPGKQLMDRIRTLSTRIQQQENASHIQAEADREATAKVALLATVAGSLILLFFFIAGFQPLLVGEPQSGFEPTLPAYGVVLAVILVATLLRMSLTPLVGPSSMPFITYFPAVLFAAWYGGFRVGAFAILLSALTSWYFFVSSGKSFAVGNPGDLIGILLFIFVGFGLTILSDSQRRAIARRRAAEDAERELRVRFEHLNQTLARSNEDLEAFAFMASHDLQEPLRMIAVYSELLVRKYPAQSDSDAAMFVDNIVDGVNRMRRLLSDLLTLAETGGSNHRTMDPVDTNRVIESVTRNLKASIDASGAAIECESLPAICAAESHLISLFQNLIGNAIKYRGQTPLCVRIFATPENGYVRFAVSDNGIGIALEHHAKIFAPFQRLHGKKVPGSGIGLTICKRIVARYGGRIWVESEEGKGSTFCFTLPSERSSLKEQKAG
jgi:signal transduction histidine kinase